MIEGYQYSFSFTNNGIWFASMKKEVLASSANKLLMLLSNHLTALKNHLLKVQLKTLYLLGQQKITRIFNLSAITHSNNISELILTLELRACARASCRYDGENGTRSLARSIGRFL